MASNSNRDFEKESVWRARVEKQKTSGLSQSEFCRKEGIKDNRFCYWKKTIEVRDRKESKTKSQQIARVEESKQAKTGFIPMVVVNESASTLPEARDLIKIVITQIQIRSDAKPELITAIIESFKL